MTLGNLHLALLPNSNASTEIITIDGHSIFVVDDALADPEEARSLALALDYGLHSGRRDFRQYPGERAQISLYPATLIECLLARLNKHTPYQLSPEQLVKYPATFTRMNSALVPSLDPRQIVPHLDVESVYSAVVYLSRQSNGGTAFYRHRETGLAYLPAHPTKPIADAMRVNGFSPTSAADYRDFRKFLMYTNLGSVRYNGSTGLPGSTVDWELINMIDIKWNRLVLFPSTIFHSPVFDVKSADGYPITDDRLTLNIFMTRE